MVSLTQLAHAHVAEHVQQAETVIDATCGNGHDTEFLCQLVGDEGIVIACDIQQAALEATQQRCIRYANLRIEQGNHADVLASLVPDYAGRAAAVMFNLGYLPGGNHQLTTQPESTVAAIDAAWQLLRPQGVLSVLAYVGHPGGLEEAEAVAAAMSRWITMQTADAIEFPEAVSGKSPRLMILRKRPGASMRRLMAAAKAR